MKNKRFRILGGIIIILVLFAFAFAPYKKKEPVQTDIASSDILEYTGSPYVIMNENIPFFTDDELTDVSFESYSPLDRFGRCGTAYASVGQDLMPTEERESIGSVKPSGWQTVKYTGIVDGNYLYNRCHLLGYQLTGENANTENLITGTRYMNTEGMLPFENMVADYVKETGNHVMYRVTPVFYDNNLVASGVLMEAKSVEDNGDGILFNVFCYNVQPGIRIDYATGDSTIAPSPETIQETSASTTESGGYVANMNTGKFHHAWCSSANQINEHNKYFGNSRDEMIRMGYRPCKLCNP